MINCINKLFGRSKGAQQRCTPFDRNKKRGLAVVPAHARFVYRFTALGSYLLGSESYHAPKCLLLSRALCP